MIKTGHGTQIWFYLIAAHDQLTAYQQLFCWPESGNRVLPNKPTTFEVLIYFLKKQ